MADKPIDIASDPEKIKEVREGLAGLTGDNDELTEAQYQSVLRGRELVALLERQTQLYEKLRQLKEDDIAATAGRQDISSQERQAQLAVLQAEKEKLEQAKEAYVKFAADKKKLLTEQLEDEIKAYEKAQAATANADKRRSDAVAKRHEKELKSVRDLAAKGVQGSAAAIKTLFRESGPTLKLLATFRKDLGLDPVLNAMKAELKNFDTNYRGVVKNFGHHSRSMTIAMSDAMAPAASIFRGMEMPLRDVGIVSKDSAEALGAVLDGAASFRPSFMRANRATAAFTVNLVAGLRKIGVQQRDSVRAVDIFNKALGKTPDQANRATKQLVSVANSLEINVGRAFKDFGALMPSLAAFGDRAVEVFGELAAQARATGMEIGKLNQFAMGLDTFKGAAEVAQRFNAVLGGTFLSVTDLVQADPADKIAMIQKAIADANIDFATADRRLRQVITSALGLKDVESAARILGNREEFDDAVEGLDTTAASQEDLTKQIQNSFDQAESLKRGIGNLGAGFREFSERTRKLAVGGANAITKSIRSAVKETKDGEAAAIGMLIAFQGLSGAAGEFQGKVDALGIKRLAKKAGAGGLAGLVGFDVFQDLNPAQAKRLEGQFDRATRIRDQDRRERRLDSIKTRAEALAEAKRRKEAADMHKKRREAEAADAKARAEGTKASAAERFTAESPEVIQKAREFAAEQGAPGFDVKDIEALSKPAPHTIIIKIGDFEIQDLVKEVIQSEIR